MEEAINGGDTPQKLQRRWTSFCRLQLIMLLHSAAARSWDNSSDHAAVAKRLGLPLPLTNPCDLRYIQLHCGQPQVSVRAAASCSLCLFLMLVFEAVVALFFFLSKSRTIQLPHAAIDELNTNHVPLQ